MIEHLGRIQTWRLTDAHVTDAHMTDSHVTGAAVGHFPHGHLRHKLTKCFIYYISSLVSSGMYVS